MSDNLCKYLYVWSKRVYEPQGSNPFSVALFYHVYCMYTGKVLLVEYEKQKRKTSGGCDPILSKFAPSIAAVPNRFGIKKTFWEH